MSGSLTVQVHPLVVMNIGDHLTRARYRTNIPGGPRVIGVILGKQEGRVLEVANTIETRFKTKQTLQGSTGEIEIDVEFTQMRINAYKTMYPDLDCIGWYSADAKGGPEAASDQPSNDDMNVLKNTITKFAENPFMLIMNPKSQAAKDKKKIPFFLFEQAAKQADGQAPPKPFVQVDYSLASEDSEQIAVDGVANAIDPDAKVSKLTQNMSASINAVKLLRAKLNFLIKVVKESPEVRANQNFMRRLNQVVTSTPIVAQEEYDSQIFGEYSDSAALNMLASVTQSCGKIQTLIDDFNLMQSGEGGFGLDEGFGGGGRRQMRMGGGRRKKGGFLGGMGFF